MAKIQNLERLKEIAEALPKLEKGRSLLSGDGCRILVYDCKRGDNPRDMADGVMDMPGCVRLGLLNVVNLEINRMKEELKDL